MHIKDATTKAVFHLILFVYFMEKSESLLYQILAVINGILAIFFYSYSSFAKNNGCDYER